MKLPLKFAVRDGRQYVVSLAATALALGGLIYIIDRAPGSVYLFPAGISLYDGAPHWFGALGGCLPDFLHAFAFSLVTAILLGVSRATALACSAGWWLIDSLFEFGQHPAVSHALAAALPAWFEDIPVLMNTAAYFIHGTFDPWDIAAITAGSVCACVLLLHSKDHSDAGSH